jgi:hypothetical protein
MRRREFISGLSAMAWPFAVRAQPAERARRINAASAVLLAQLLYI